VQDELIVSVLGGNFDTASNNYSCSALFDDAVTEVCMRLLLRDYMIHDASGFGLSDF
jgi:hypothetical protein